MAKTRSDRHSVKGQLMTMAEPDPLTIDFPSDLVDLPKTAAEKKRALATFHTLMQMRTFSDWLPADVMHAGEYAVIMTKIHAAEAQLEIEGATLTTDTKTVSNPLIAVIKRLDGRAAVLARTIGVGSPQTERRTLRSGAKASRDVRAVKAQTAEKEFDPHSLLAS